jgi:tripartite ATP-independent transporter DctM subunit
MVFAGVSGSAVADAAAVGSVMIPAMKREGYGAPYAAAVTAAAATIGPVIPPSIPFVVYGLFALVSVGKLFLAGVIPGLLMGAFLLTASYLISRRRDYPATAWSGWRELVAAFADAFFALMMPVMVIVGLVGGVATVNEVGAIAVVYAIVVGAFVYRQLDLSKIWHACCRSGVDACKVLIIVATSGIFIWIVGNMGLARALATWVSGLTGDPTVVLAIFAVVLLAAGLILEPVIILVVLVPLMIPTAKAVGIDLIQLGVVSVLATLIGLITPPVGFLIFLSAAQAEAPAHRVVRELLPFVAALVLLLVLLVAFPELSLFLPRMVMG